MKQAMATALGCRQKVLAVLLLSVAAPLPATAQPPLNAQLASCLAIFGSVERLACYDRIARAATGQASAVAPLAPRPAPGPAPQLPPRAPAGQEFGSEQVRGRTPPAQSSRMAADITGVTVNPFGKFTVTLANGQVWRQLDSDDRTVRPRKTMHSVRIERGLMGSYNLQFNDSSLVYKVSRSR